MIDDLFEPAHLLKFETEPGFEPLPFIDAVDLLEKPFEPPQFFVQHLVPKASIVLLTGDTGAAKTAFAMHLAVAMATDQHVAGRFAVEAGARVLYVNGEMGSSDIVRFLQEAVAGLGRRPRSGRLLFEGSDAVASFSMAGGVEACLQLEELVERKQPSVVVLDTQRALLVQDENNGVEVRRAFSWLRSAIVHRFGASVLVAHHLRKVGQVSNTDRERVSGSRDIIASVDVHLAARASSGQPMNALAIGKTRTPIDSVKAGVAWPIDARLEAGTPSRSIFIAGDPTSAEGDKSAQDTAASEIRGRLNAEARLTIAELDIRSGTQKRAWRQLLKTGEVKEVGKIGRKQTYALADNEANEW